MQGKFECLAEKMKKRKHSILVVDDHPILREAISRLIEQAPDLLVCAQADSCRGALKLIETIKPDVAILDISLKDGSGITLLEEIRRRAQGTKVLMFSMYDEVVYAERCLRTGASGYVMKSADPSLVVEGVRAILRGQVFVSDALKDTIMRGISGKGQSRPGTIADSLTNREMEVFQAIGLGFTTKEISANLNLSPKTVQTYREHIKRKLKIGNTIELAQRAIQWMQSESIPLKSPSK